MMDGRPVACPVVLPYLGIFLRDHWRQVTDVPWWESRRGDVETHLKVVEDQRRALQIDWVPVGIGSSRSWRERHEVRVRDGRAFLADRETGREQELFDSPPGGDQNVPREGPVHTREDVDRLVRVPDAEEMRKDGRLDAAKAVAERFGKDHFLLGSIGAPLWGTHGYFGFYRMMTSLVESPDLVEYLLERLTATQMEYLKALSMAGADGIWLEECYTSADIISLPHFRRFGTPYVRRLIQKTRELGMRPIHYFCGDVSDRLEDLVGMRPDCLSLEESKKGFRIEIEEVARTVADRTCLLGNVDAVGILEKGDDAALTAEVRRQIRAGRGAGRFILSLGSPVTPGTTTDRVRRFVDIARAVAEEESGG
jgi:uroporphyrinogen-III decarboxylase